MRNQETNLGNLSADANGLVAQAALGSGTGFIVSLKNGGGIRTAIGAADVATGRKLAPIANAAADKPAGAVSLLDVENSLRFDNKLMVFDTTAEGLKAILEHGVASLGTQGRFPQIGGISFSYDPAAAAGSRIRDLALKGDGYTVNLYSDGVKAANVPSTITVVTLSFLANGGDSYPIKANGSNFRFLTINGDNVGVSGAVDEALNFTATGVAPTNGLGEQATLVSYLQALHGTPETAFDIVDTSPASDSRIQDTSVRREAVLASGVTISVGAGVATGSALDDTFLVTLASTGSVVGGSGKDTVLATSSVNLGNSGVFSLVENATLLGGDDLDLTGNSGANRLVGNAGDNRLEGGRGVDTLTGGAGSDEFVLRKGSVDRITDFARGDDLIVLSSTDFSKSAALVRLVDGNFDQFISYNAKDGVLSVDTNGLASGGLVKIAIIGNKPAELDSSDFLVVAG